MTSVDFCISVLGAASIVPMGILACTPVPAKAVLKIAPWGIALAVGGLTAGWEGLAVSALTALVAEAAIAKLNSLPERSAPSQVH